MKFFFPEGYAPNIALGTGNNAFLHPEHPGLYTFRALIRPLMAGRFDWRFFYRNVLDSTWDDGSESRGDMPGGAFEIVNARVSVCRGPQEQMTGFQPVSWGGRTRLTLEPGEEIWSEPVNLDCPEGKYLVFDWCLDCGPGARIPGTPDSQSLCFMAPGNRSGQLDLTGFSPSDSSGQMVLPNLWAAKRPFRSRIGFLGDSITQGCGTRPGFYEHWAARILEQLGQDHGGWNLGMGFGRAQDAARGGSWLSKAAALDHVCVCLGVNDILQGRTAGDLWHDLCAIREQLKILNPALRLTQFTIPPFDLEGNHLSIWREINGRLRTLADAGEIELFDIAWALSAPGPNEHLAPFGPHPDGAGGAAVAQIFLKWLAKTSI